MAKSSDATFYLSPKEEKIIAEYIDFTDVTPTTKSSYRSEIERFVSFAKKGLLSMRETDSSRYLAYLDDCVALKEERELPNNDDWPLSLVPITPRTHQKKIKILSRFFRYITYESVSGLVPESYKNPFSSIPVTSEDRLYDESNVLSLTQCRELFNLAFKHSRRDYLFFQTLFFSLIKPGRLLTLERNHIETGKKSVFTEVDWGYIYIPDKKEHVNRTVRIPLAIATMLIEYMDGHDAPTIFASDDGTSPLIPATILRHLKHYGETIGIATELRTSIAIYHAGVFHALKGGMSSEHIKEQLGIYDLSHLSRYKIPEFSGEGVPSSCDYIEIHYITNKKME